MLLQSRAGVIELLPALPDSWHTGSFRDFLAAGGAVVDLDWRDGKPVRAVISASVPGRFEIRTPGPGAPEEVELEAGGSVVITF